MNSKLRGVMIASGAIALMASASAVAAPGHQAHRGACANTTTSITRGISDLNANGVLSSVASQMGIRKLDGDVGKQMRNQLVVGRVAQATTTNNHGCDGHGGMSGAGKRTLYKGERVVVRVPAKYGKDARSSAAKGYKAVTITVKVALPASCWNVNTGTIRVVIFVKKTTPKGPTTAPSSTPTPTCAAGQVLNGTQCVSQSNTSTQTASVDTTQTSKQDCEAKGGTWVNSAVCQTTITNVTVINQTTVQINANCSKVTVSLSDGTTKVTYADGSGNVITESFCSTVINNPPPAVQQSIHITASTTLNDIPTGKSSGPVYVTVNASAAGGSLTIDPNIGAVSTCDSTTPTGSVTFSSLAAGNSNLCVILYAPDDPGSHPSTMTVTMTATLGSAFDIKSSTFGIKYPVRP